MTEAVQREVPAGPGGEGVAGEGRRHLWLAPLRFLQHLAAAVGFGRFLSLALLALLLVVRVWDPAPLQLLRLKTFDTYQYIEPREAHQQLVAIVDIDEASLAELGQWPWPRTVVADLVTKIMDYGALALAFDVVFAEPDRVSPANVADALRGVDESFRTELRGLPSTDLWLANALRDGLVVVGQAGYPQPVGDPDRPLKSVPIATLGGDPRPFLTSFEGLVRNIPILEESARGFGMFSVNPETDGVVRRVPAISRVGDMIYPTLSLELLRVATGGKAVVIKTDEAGVQGIVIGGAEIPTDRHGRLWVHFSETDPRKYVSAKDVLADTASPEKLAGKLVLVGTSATGLLDIKTTPVESAMPGVEVHAQLLETIFADALLTRPHYALGAELAMTALVGLLVIIVVPIMGALWTLILGSTIAISLAAFSWYLYTEKQLLIDVGYTLISSFLIYGTLVYVNYFREEVQRRQVRGAFSQYLSPALVEQLASNPKRLVLGGEAKVMTFLFCDVRGFTTISEQFKTDPQGLTSLINRFLTPLTDAILATRGTIDKYMGDCIMAFWNAPLDDPKHAEHGCKAALDMLHALHALNETRREEAEAENLPYLNLKVGIGLNTGNCTVGNMGSAQRFDYSVLGDAVNLASRLEGQSKFYGVPIVVGSITKEQVDGRFALLELDLIAVKGKVEPERIFALVGPETMAHDPRFHALSESNQSMLDCYRSRDWAGAKAAVAACRERDFGLELEMFYELYETRIAEFEAEPPPPGWAGVYVAETK